MGNIDEERVSQPALLPESRTDSSRMVVGVKRSLLYLCYAWLNLLCTLLLQELR